jgi:hypothetical protein
VTVLEFNCEECGARVFSPTRRARRWCSEKCSAKAWNRTHARTSGRNGLQSCTITVLYVDNGLRTFVGYGETKREAHEDAAAWAQRRGAYTEVGHVTPRKVLADLERTNG